MNTDHLTSLDFPPFASATRQTRARGKMKTLVLLGTALAVSTLLHAQDAKKIDPSKLDLSKMKPEEIQKMLAENPPIFMKVAVKGLKWKGALRARFVVN